MDQYKEAREYLRKKKLEESKKSRLDRAWESHHGTSTEFKIKESFEWLVPEIIDTVPVGKNTVRVKVRAARVNDVSRNKRKYVEEELRASARTWVGKPILVNHDPKRVIGDITYSAYENGNLEFLLNVNKAMYSKRLREKDPSHKGWSVGADFFYMRCPDCGHRATSVEELTDHMKVNHLKHNFHWEPRGMMGTEISYVESPETPGLPTETQLVETQNGWLKLCETVVEERGYALRKVGETSMAKAKLKLGEPKDAHGCEPDETWDGEKCVKKAEAPKAEEQDEDHGCGPDEEWDGEKCVKKTEEQEEEPRKECGPGKVWDANTKQCVSLNQAVESLLSYKRNYEKILAVADKNAMDLQEHIKTLEERLLLIGTEADIRKGLGCGTFLDSIKERLDGFRRDLEELKAQNNPSKLQETEETAKVKKQLEEILTRQDNLEAKLRGQFKGHSKTLNQPSNSTDLAKHMRDSAKKRN